jgi:hypothetical protein
MTDAGAKVVHYHHYNTPLKTRCVLDLLVCLRMFVTDKWHRVTCKRCKKLRLRRGK